MGTIKADLTAATEMDNAVNNPAPEETTTTGDTGEGSPPEPGTDGSETGTNEDGTPKAPEAGSEGEPESSAKEEGEDLEGLKTLLKESGLSVDDFAKVVENDKDLKAALDGRDVKDLLEKASKLEDLEKQWAIDKEAELRESEEPEETIARLDKERADEKARLEEQVVSSQNAEENRKALENYDSHIATSVAATDLPESHKELLTSILSSSHPTMSIDFSNKGDVGKMVKEMQGKLKAFSDGVIKDYTDGKTAIPPVTPSTPVTPDLDAGKPKTILEATKAAVAKLRRAGEK